MDKQSLNDKICQLEHQHLCDIVAQLVDKYCIPSFGSMSKHDLDLLMFDSMVKMGVISKPPHNI